MASSLHELSEDLKRLPLEVFRYRKFFKAATSQRWYCELVLHGKVEFDFYEAWLNGYSDEDAILNYHKLAGCYLKTLRSERNYRSSRQGKIDSLRDDILNLENDIKRQNIYYCFGKELQDSEMQKLAIEMKQLYQNQKNIFNQRLVKLIAGRI